jgi:hypothetical protein
MFEIYKNIHKSFKPMTSATSNEIRILDKSTYSRKTLETFEMIGAYYVDLFYNHLYFEAKKLRNDKVVGSITEGYKHTLTSFLQGIEDPKLYKKSLLAMHTFFIDNGFASISFTQCIERVTREFIPEDYYESVINSKKNSILRSVLSNVNKTFILKLVNSYFGMIIDQHNESDNARVLQDEFIDLLLMEKESMYKRFIVGKTKTNKNSSHANSAVLESMQKEIKLLCSEKYELNKLKANLKKIILAKEAQHTVDVKKIEQLNNIINELKSELRDNNLKPIVSVDTAMFIEDAANETEETAEVEETAEGEDAIEEVEETAEETKETKETAEDIGKIRGNSSNLTLEDALNSQLEETSDLFSFDENTNIWG